RDGESRRVWSRWDPSAVGPWLADDKLADDLVDAVDVAHDVLDARDRARPRDGTGQEHAGVLDDDLEVGQLDATVGAERVVDAHGELVLGVAHRVVDHLAAVLAFAYLLARWAERSRRVGYRTPDDLVVAIGAARHRPRTKHRPCQS